MKQLVDTYEFTDAEGQLLFRKERFETSEGKRFRYRCPCKVPLKVRRELPPERWKLWSSHKPNDQNWKGCVGAVVADHHLFIPRPLARGKAVWWTEGEKDARTLCGLGARAVSTHQGAGHSTPEQAAVVARAGVRGVWVAMDRDVPGARDAWDRYLFLKDLGVRARIVLPFYENDGADMTDHFGTGMKVKDLIEPPLSWVEEQASKYTRRIGAAYGYEVA
jgi:hypothetical protein